MNLMHAECYGISDVGLVRQNNEDVWAVLPEKQFFILADGMGGHQAGEIASSFAVESMCESIRELPENASIEVTCQHLRRAISKANTKVFKESHLRSDYAGMGTTLTCCIIVGDFLIYAQIGDSRLYRYRRLLQQLSEDHSQRLKDARFPGFGRTVITRAIGTQSTILPDIGVIPMHSNDLYLLCSDGLSDYVDKKTLSKNLSSPASLEEIGRNLIEAALEKGGNDNITLLLIKIMS